MKYLFDTNAVINYISDEGNFPEIQNKEIAISFITEIELSVGYKSQGEQQVGEYFIQQSLRMMINDHILQRVIEIRSQLSIKIPDAIILATAQIHKLILVTSDNQLIREAIRIGLNTINPME